MKLYTEEQIKEAIRLAREKYPPDIILTEQGILTQIEPIELPNDADIHKQATNHSNLYDEFRAGATWVLNRIYGSVK